MAESGISIGNKARAFTLLNQDDEKVSLKDYQGRWVVLYFYPRDDTPGCTKEACQFTTHLSDFESLDAVVLGVSPDTPEKHRKFIEKYDLKIGLLSDPDHIVMEKYGAWGEKVSYGKTSVGVRRSTVLIDPDGRLAWYWRNVRADGHAEKVRDKLKELQVSQSD